MKAFLILLLIGLSEAGFSQPGVWHGTTIFGTITRQEIIVGADSKGITGNRKRSTLNLCKIFQTNNIVFAVAGANRVGTLNIGRSVEDVCNKGKSYRSVIDTCKNKYTAFLAEYFESLTARSPKIPSDAFKKFSLEIYFFTYDKSGTRFDRLRFQLQQHPDGRYLPVCTRDSMVTTGWADDRYDYISGGHADHIFAFTKSHPPSPQERSTKSFIKTMIKLEFDPVNPDVGGFIDVVRISPKGIKWETDHRKCVN